MRYITLVALMVVASLCCSGHARAADKKEKDRTINGSVINAVTSLGTTDTIRVELLDGRDSVLSYTFCNFYYPKYPDKTFVDNNFTLVTQCSPGTYTLRVSNPDYETACYPVEVKSNNNYAGVLKLRKYSRYEKGLMLGEVVVQASKVVLINKGDTIQYNADAFSVAQGSMLDALIEQMPGVQIRDNGQIFVNGRFVEKLLLDGKDFFKDDQLVLLQNLPAYTVKNIKVYEEASALTEVLGKGAMDAQNPDKFVMDVILKKGYNTGWIANAEAGGGTHNRYRARGFVSAYTKSLRLSAYGYINNLNEVGTPGQGGNWPDPDGGKLRTIKAGGIDYGFFKEDKTVELNGNVTGKYINQTENIFVNRQNFLQGGDTYTRRWTDNVARNASLNTSHSIKLRPRTGSSYQHWLQLSLSYNSDRSKKDLTEGTFNRDPGEAPDLRQQLTDGWPEGTDAANRYLDFITSRNRPLTLSWMQSSTIAIGGNESGLELRSDGYYSRATADNDETYLLQYAGEDAEETPRTNPQKSHDYRYWVGLRYNKSLNAYWNVFSMVAYCHEYHYKDNNLYVGQSTTAGLNGNRGPAPETALPSMLAETRMRLDPRNSYHTGFRHNHEYICAGMTYYKQEQRDGRPYRQLSIYVQPGFNLFQPNMSFYGETAQHISRRYITPESAFQLFWFLPGMAPRLNLEYKIIGSSIDMMNLVDNRFDSDPLNIRIGNPDLKSSITHRFDMGYISMKELFRRLTLSAFIAVELQQRQTAMSYAYDRATGVRTYKPVNVDGNRTGWLSILSDLYLDRAKRIKFSNWLWLQPTRSVDMISYDDFSSTEESVVNSFTVRNTASVEYNIKKHMVAVEGRVETRRATSARTDFEPFRVTKFSYGVRGRAALPAQIEISTDLRMHSTRGFNDNSMNINQLVWNARISKSLLNGQLMVAVDGYDILQRVKNITYSINAQGRTETWVNNIPSYVMFSLRWNFTKKPRE